MPAAQPEVKLVCHARRQVFDRLCNRPIGRGRRI
jgi:hypothetical protein